MEKVPAACAMEWSIELEKGLRSKRPGRPIEVIEQTGSKLLKWSKESCISMSASNMYGLVPGEERSFTNTILLRLADAFKSGDNCMKACIVKVFLLELRHIRQKGRSYDGILSKQRLPNYSELLKRVRFAFDSGDLKARALSIQLLGCWAPLTHADADVRYLILLSLRSDNVLEVKASLFASGCLCRFSDDFSYIILGKLVDIIYSVNVPSSVKLGAARAFGEIQCSSRVAKRAYKTGKKLVLDLKIEHYTVEMLSSLSKLAVKSVILISEQVDILLSFLSQECAPVIKYMALKCIRFLHLRMFSQFPISKNVFSTLFHKIDDPGLPTDLQCDVLKTLRQLFSGPPKICYSGIPEFPNLIMIVEHASVSPYTSKRYMALSLLVDISCNAKWGDEGNYSYTEKMSTEYVSSHLQMSSGELSSVIDDAVLLARHVIVLLISLITFMTKNMHVEVDRGAISWEDAGLNCTADELRQNYSVIFNHILHLIREYPELGLMVLNRFKSLIEELVNFRYKFSTEDPPACGNATQMENNVDEPNQVFEFQECDRGRHAQYTSEIVFCICCCSIRCLNILNENGLIGAEVCATIKLLIDCLQRVEYCNSDVCEMVSFRMYSYITFHSCGIKDYTRKLSEPDINTNLNFSENDCWDDHERLALGLARRMMNRGKHWMVYRAGKYSCCEGLWFTATYAFRKLIASAKSDSCHHWLKSLLLLAGAESEMKLLLFPKVGIKLISELYSDSSCGRTFEDKGERMGDYDRSFALMHGQKEKLSKVHRRICSSWEVLPVGGTLKGAFWFQHWFLKLRGKVLEILLDVLGCLDPHYHCGTNLDNHDPAKQNLGIFSSLSVEDMNLLTSHFSRISSHLNKLAGEYDFLASFMDVDLESSRIISRLGIYCSLLAFCAGFPLFFSGFFGSGNFGCFENPSGFLLEDLAVRLFRVYGKSVADLETYTSSGGGIRGCLQKQLSRFNNSDTGVILVSGFAFSAFHHLQQEANKVKSKEEMIGVYIKGLQFLCNILVKFMAFPFQTPKYFFRVRCCTGAELFLRNADVGNTGELCVVPGNQLCLNLCIQLRNISPEYLARISKIYCILAAGSSRLVSKGNKEREREAFAGFQTWKIEEIVYLNDLLVSYVENETKKLYKLQGFPINKADLVTTYVCVEPNEQGQGFSTCLLDVSALPEDSYQIRWHSCCVDKSGCHWSLPVFSDAVPFTVRRPSCT